MKMRFHNERKHVIDFIFPISLFFVFAASSLIVILLAATIYSGTTETSESEFETTTVLSYITEKIRQGDEDGAVSIGDFDGREALIIRQKYGDAADRKLYVTYIYEDEGILRELFIQDGISASASSGKKIMSVHDFTLKELSDGLFQFSCASQDGKTMSTIVSVKSSEEAPNE